MRHWLSPYPKFGDGPGLERVGAVARRLGVDLAHFGENGAVIVGTNGKGSTAAMTSALLQQTGKSVALFTSPHLFDLNERFKVDDQDISDDDLERHWRRVMAAIDDEELSAKIGGFEFLFLIAADWFAERKCAHTVWEAGLGGRLDPARLIQARRLALTSLDLEHTALLGDTLEAIAREKIDAAPSGALVFAPEAIAARAAIEAHCRERGVSLQFAAPRDTAPLAGAHQRANAALAAALARDMARDMGRPITEEQMRAGFAATQWPGRLEIIEAAPLVVIDVGHTPDAIRASLEGFIALRERRRGVLVCGVSYDKNATELVGLLAPAFDAIICATAAHKGAPAAQIAALAAGANPSAEIVIAESVAEARRLAFARAKSAETAIYVAGGLFLAAEFRAVHRGRDPASLAFF